MGWKYQDVIETLEAKRKVKAEDFHNRNVTKAKAVADAERAVAAQTKPITSHRDGGRRSGTIDFKTIITRQPFFDPYDGHKSNWILSWIFEFSKQVKPGFTNYQPRGLAKRLI